ncbi:hypothetical protein CEXT_689811 [Caerostris extrusa]|uniref:Uncharacterized protein n=1 Tax=Caerostris extrusa TaxID=172846 RepID=A0AAV4WY68_CAEEX|nr:hypothetical protein CEXT_689811 [Caerostris extrusa]
MQGFCAQDRVTSRNQRFPSKFTSAENPEPLWGTGCWSSRVYRWHEKFASDEYSKDTYNTEGGQRGTCLGEFLCRISAEEIFSSIIFEMKNLEGALMESPLTFGYLGNPFPRGKVTLILTIAINTVSNFSSNGTLFHVVITTTLKACIGNILCEEYVLL